MSYPRAEPLPRILAALVDAVVAGVFSVIPVVGWAIGLLYILFRDGLLYELTRQEEWRDQSIGKRLLALKVVSLDGRNIDLLTSARRNLTLSLGGLLTFIPVLGLILGPIVGLLLGLAELVLWLNDPRGQRWGDRWANTQVVAVETDSSRQIRRLS